MRKERRRKREEEDEGGEQYLSYTSPSSFYLSYMICIRGGQYIHINIQIHVTYTHIHHTCKPNSIFVSSSSSPNVST